MGRPQNTPHFEKGTNTHIAFVFACPGWLEQFHKRPAAGDTGQNLHRFLEILREWGVPDIPAREQLTITNAHDGVMYSEQDGDTLPSRQQIRQTANLDRLRKELRRIAGWVVFCGEEAHFAASLLEGHAPAAPSHGIARIRHLGMQSINQEKTDIFSLPIDEETIKRPWHRARARLEVVAKDLLTQMNLSQYVPRAENLGRDIMLAQRAWDETVIVGPQNLSQAQARLVKRTVKAMNLELVRETPVGDKTLGTYVASTSNSAAPSQVP
ncbi:hypothetical protein [Myxococcus qinghaiensis]|uniref:hypothetical protein n=1 Tax=Myxococcus qinghaiensis TaxID=2906758 RepID=UPI0020A6E1C0|nr:hypothetical protein [Myxococcus qinghaiensis]MCP3166666.1 hypothetical protein [Myxococcus qinghaiensis]